MDNLEEMDKFLESYNLLRVNHEEIENLNKLQSQPLRRGWKMLGLREPTSVLSLTSKQGQACRRGCDSERKRKEEGEEASVEGKGSSRASSPFQWMFAC